MKTARYESWDTYHRQMLEETSRFIEWGLHHPEEVIEIPVKPADEGGFPAQVGQWFWTVALAEHPTDKLRRWRDFLLSKPRGLLRRITGQ